MIAHLSKIREKNAGLTRPPRVKYIHHFYPGVNMKDFLWWQDGVIYQIYPRSFSDSNGDGMGDLAGITARLDYLADLGIDAIWLSPFYPTPDKDFGYDVSDYTNVDPRFGSLADFDQLVAEAHQRGIRIILDLVLNHTSDQHPWFLESRSSLMNPKRDWYIWRDHPNNWQASFGGKAWEFDSLTGQYYLHLFTKEQPDVNWRNPEVRKAQLDVFRFWLGRGADGFRLDVFNAYFKHPDLPNNPPKIGLRGFDRQRHIYDIDQPEMMPFLNEMRAQLDTFPERYAVGETYFASPQKTVSYCGPNRLHAAFSFDFTTHDLSYPWNPHWVIKQVLKREKNLNAAGVWPTTVLSNHDLPRAASRYSPGEDDTQAFLAMALLLTLRGTPFMYYGEEIGMRDIHLKRNEILDPPGKKYWPLYKGRDGCRAPMQWDDSAFAGFSSHKPWLPLHPDYQERNVSTQQIDPGSLFTFTKKLLALRKEIPALCRGEFEPLDSVPGMLAYMRRSEEQSVLVAMNFSGRQVTFSRPGGNWKTILTNSDGAPGMLAPHEIQLLLLE
jgi:alpha-glucosidase